MISTHINLKDGNVAEGTSVTQFYPNEEDGFELVIYADEEGGELSMALVNESGDIEFQVWLEDEELAEISQAFAIAHELFLGTGVLFGARS